MDAPTKPARCLPAREPLYYETNDDWIECDHCGGTGEGAHDCGEDTCCCLVKDPSVCEWCDGAGQYRRSRVQ